MVSCENKIHMSPWKEAGPREPSSGSRDALAIPAWHVPSLQFHLPHEAGLSSTSVKYQPYTFPAFKLHHYLTF